VVPPSTRRAAPPLAGPSVRFGFRTGALWPSSVRKTRWTAIRLPMGSLIATISARRRGALELLPHVLGQSAARRKPKLGPRVESNHNRVDIFRRQAAAVQIGFGRSARQADSLGPNLFGVERVRVRLDRRGPIGLPEARECIADARREWPPGFRLRLPTSRRPLGETLERPGLRPPSTHIYDIVKQRRRPGQCARQVRRPAARGCIPDTGHDARPGARDVGRKSRNLGADPSLFVESRHRPQSSQPIGRLAVDVEPPRLPPSRDHRSSVGTETRR
jgi:hypothetical protein